jgi:Bacterial Ig-like domain (group 1)
MPALCPRRALVAALLSASFTGCDGDAGPRPPSVVRVTEGDGQIARVGTVLPAPIVVTVLNADGQPVEGARVDWRTDDGQLLPVAGETDAFGEARARWQLDQVEGARTGTATVPGTEPAMFTAIGESADALPFDQVMPLPFSTYDGSGQIVHPDFAATPAGALGLPLHLAITPYPFGNAAFENPSFFESRRRDSWALPQGGPDPVVFPATGYLSDPDLVYVPDLGELWLYYRQVTSDNIVQLVRTSDGQTWSAPVEVLRAPNHQIVSPSVVRRAIGDWRMFAVNSGSIGCGAASTVVMVRRSTDGIHWGPAAPVQLSQPDLWPWHIDVQWVPQLNRFWALYNVKTAGSCTTPAVYLAESLDGRDWQVVAQPVLVKGAIPELEDIVYRSTFEYDPATDAVTFWFSGARYDGGRYRWGAAVERRHWAEVTQPGEGTIDPAELPPAPAPLEEWP